MSHRTIFVIGLISTLIGLVQIAHAGEVLELNTFRKPTVCQTLWESPQFLKYMSAVNIQNPALRRVVSLAIGEEPSTKLTLVKSLPSHNPSELFAQLAKYLKATETQFIFIAGDGSLHTNFDVNFASMTQLRDTLEERRKAQGRYQWFRFNGHKNGLYRSNLSDELSKLAGHDSYQRAILDTHVERIDAIEKLMEELPGVPSLADHAVMLVNLDFGRWETRNDDRLVIEEFLLRLSQLAERSQSTGGRIIATIPSQKWDALSVHAPIRGRDIEMIDLNSADEETSIAE
jgi:hypothetical protein